MEQNLFLLGWLLLMLILNIAINPYQSEVVLGKRKIRTTWAFAILTFLPIIIMAGTRGNIADTLAYKRSFEALPSSFFELIEYVPHVTKDKGFSFLSGLIKCLVGNRSVIYFSVLAIFQGFSLISLYRKYSSNYIFSIFLFIASTDYLSWMFNGIRQFTAVTIILFATTFMLEKKWVLTTILILLASTMHQSALLMIPIVIVVQGKAWNLRTIIYLLVALVAVLYANQFTTLLDEMMQDTQYSNMVTDWKLWGDDGTNALRVLVYSLPTIIMVFGLRYINVINDPVIHFCANMSIVSTGLYLISMVTSGIFIGRLPIYASLYNYILLPWEIDNIFEKKSAQFIKICAVICYVGFNFYQILVAW